MNQNIIAFALLIVVLLFQNCSPYQNALPCRRFDSTIIEKASTYKWWFGLPDSVQTFHLKQRDLKKVEKILKTVFKEKILAENFESKIPLNNYNRQYFGYKNAEGQRIVLVQCFQARDHIDPAYWRTQFFFMDDGCEGVFRVKINVETGAWFDFNINPCA